MREILFRGKDISGQWHYGVPLIFTEDFVCITAPHTFNKKVETETLGQYTGLKDGNGSKIFEGDIVEIYDTKYETVSEGSDETNNLRVWQEYVGEHRYFGQVIFTGGSFVADTDVGYLNLDWYQEVEIEVVGNIYDNPELMGG